MALSKYWSAYLGQLREHPVRTKAVTSAALAAFADISAQKLVGVPWLNLNTKSTRNQALFAFCVRAPMIHYWLDLLERVFQRLGLSNPDRDRDNGGPPFSIVLLKVLVDQALFAPVLMLVYLHVMGVLERKPLAVVQQNISANFVSIMLANYKVWPLVGIVNFRLVPPHLRVLFGNVVAVFWLIYLITKSKK